MKKLLFPIFLVVLFFVFAPKAFAADRYWVGGTASWDATAGTKWATSTGGVGGAAVPTTADNVYFDANSTGTVTASAGPSALNLNFTGFTGTFAGGAGFSLFGSLTMGSGMTNNYTGTINFNAGSGTQTVTSNGIAFGSIFYMVGASKTVQLIDALTIKGTGGLILFSGAFNANSQTVSLIGTAHTITGSFTFYNLTRTGTTAKTDTLTLASNITVSSTLTINGNSTTSRLLIQSNTLGTARTLTAATVSVSNADFRDITGAGTGSWDLSAITGKSGNAGGNTGITFTTAATQYWKHGATASDYWATVGNWYLATNGGGGAGRVPLPQDDVVFDANSFAAIGKTVTMDMPRLGKSIDMSGVTNTPTFTPSTAASIFGSLTLDNLTLTASTQAYTFEGRGNYTLTNNGKTWAKSITLNAPGGTLTLQDALATGVTNTLTITNGAFATNNFNVTAGLVSMGSGATTTMGSGTWTVTGTGTLWTGAGTVNANSSTIKIIDASATAKTFAGGGKTYYNLWFTGAGTGNFIITGSNTFNDFKVDTPPHTILFTNNTTTTVSTFTVSGTAGNLMTVSSTVTGVHRLVKAGGGVVSSDYLSIKSSVASPAATWYAGANSTDGGGNTGWIFTAPPGGTLPGQPGTPTYASVGTSTLSVSWTPATDADYYKIERATSSEAYIQLATTTVTSIADSGRTPNTTYFYRLRGTNAQGDGPYSATSSQLMLPDAPGTPTYTNIGTSTVTVNWTAPTGGADYFRVERGANGNGPFPEQATTTSLFYNDFGLAASTTYWYRSRGTNATGNGPYSATSSVTTQSVAPNSPPNAPSQDSPANSSQNVSVTPVFKMTATDPESDKLQYKVTLYSNSGCTTVFGTYNQSSSQIGWSGQNTTCFSGSDCYTSGSQGTYTVQSALFPSATYWWKASAKDPLGSNTWSSDSDCNSFTTTSGNWTTDSGSWKILSNQLTVKPSSGSSARIYVTNQSQQNGVIEFKLQSSGVGANTGNAGGFVRDTGSGSRYNLTTGDFQNNKELVGETISGSYSTITSSTFTFSAGTFYEFRGYISGNNLKSWINGGTPLSTTDSSLSGAGFLGLAASSTNGSVTSTYDNFVFYTSSTITMNNLPGGGSWAVRDHLGNVTSTCLTASTWDLSTYPGQVPVDYNSGGGSVAVWTNATCSGGPAVTYPQLGLAADIFGGDTYSYSGGGQPTTVVRASSTITVFNNGLISF